MFVFAHTSGVVVLERAILAPSATVVYDTQSAENATVEPVAVVSTSKNWYSVAEYSIAGNPHAVARYVAVVVAVLRDLL